MSCSQTITTYPRSYPPGAICALQPRCSDAEVDEFLESNKLEAEADKVFVIRSTVPGELSHG